MVTSPILKEREYISKFHYSKQKNVHKDRGGGSVSLYFPFYTILILNISKNNIFASLNKVYSDTCFI
jgi:hypothetical protein